MSNGPVRVSCEVLDRAEILRQAVTRTDAMRRTMPSYGRTSAGMNEVGLYGEHVVHHYLSKQTSGITMPDPDDYAHGDIHVFRPFSDEPTSGPVISLEVKTSRFSDWKHYGRLLDAGQLERVRSIGIVWCVVADELPTTGVTIIIMGWLPVEEICAGGSNEHVSAHGRPHVRVHHPMRSPADLTGWIDTIDVGPMPRF